MSDAKKTIGYLGGSTGALQGNVYIGFDPAGGTSITLHVGDEAEVSAAKAAQLAKDHPGCFKIDGKIAGKRASRKAADDDGDLSDQLSGYTRDELNAAAAKLGVDAPEALPNKAAVVDAIVAAKAV